MRKDSSLAKKTKEQQSELVKSKKSQSIHALGFLRNLFEY